MNAFNDKFYNHSLKNIPEEEDDRYFVMIQRKDYTVDNDNPSGKVEETQMQIDRKKVIRATFDSSENK